MRTRQHLVPTNTITGCERMQKLLDSVAILYQQELDSLEVNGVAEVTMTTNLGYALITVLTLGIWSPIKVQWKCSKPCQPTGTL